MTTQNPQQPEQSAPSLGPGDRLQAARISNGLTLEDVANRMHLSESILNSLEDNDFEDITAPIFVKGYLRAYARIVNVDEEDIIEQYNSFYTDGDPPITSTSNTVPEINADDARVKWVTWLVTFGLIALLTVWWWNRYQQPAQPLSLDSTQPFESINPQAQSQMQIGEDSAVAATDAAILSKQAGSALEKINAQPAGMESSPGDEPMATEQVPEPVVEPEPVIEQSAPISAQVPASNVSQFPGGADVAEDSTTVEIPLKQDGLVIVVNADTWANITDADGNRLVRDLLRAGDTHNLTGKPPISIFLGNGYGVTMQYNGEDVDFSDNIRDNNTARVSVGR